MLRPINSVKHRPVWNKIKELMTLGAGVGIVAFSAMIGTIIGISLALQFNGAAASLFRYIKSLF